MIHITQHFFMMLFIQNKGRFLFHSDDVFCFNMFHKQTYGGGWFFGQASKEAMQLCKW